MTIFLMATGKIDPRRIKLNGDHAIFVLQSGFDEYDVKTVGLEQLDIIKDYSPSQSVFVLGTARGRKKIIITPRLIMSLDQINGQRRLILDTARQIMESHL